MPFLSLSEINECLQFDTCPHYCTNTKGSFKCTCDRNYKEIHGNCIAKGRIPKFSHITFVAPVYHAYLGILHKKSDQCSIVAVVSQQRHSFVKFSFVSFFPLQLMEQGLKTEFSTWLMTPKSGVLCIHSTRVTDTNSSLTLKTTPALSGWMLCFTTKSLSGLPSSTPEEFFLKILWKEVRQSPMRKTL